MARYILILGVGALLAGCAHVNQDADRSPYDLPQVSPGLVFLSLPAAVQNTIRAEVGIAEIFEIQRYGKHGGAYYKVWFRNSNTFPPLYIAADGSVLNPDLSVALAAPTETYEALTSHNGTGTLTVADLPAEVVKTIQSRAKSLEIGRINESTENDKHVYEIQFKDSKTAPMMKVDQDGKVIESTLSDKPAQ